MPWPARIAIPGIPHHVTQRGNNRQDIFFAGKDRHLHLDFVRDHASELGVAILGCCLMTEHVHSLVVSSGEEPLSLALGRARWRYSQAINRLHGRLGT